MHNFHLLRELCERNNVLTASVFDDILIQFAAETGNTEKVMVERFGRYIHVIDQLPRDAVYSFFGQYLMHRLVKKNGFIHTKLKQALFRVPDPEAKEFVVQQREASWHFSFSQITARPAPDFFEMQDVFTGENFLLFSPSITETEKEGSRSLWFNLVGNNGSCWQTYGPVVGYRALMADDIFFYATELNPNIETEAQLYAHVEENPVPYIMLFAHSEIPPVISGDFTLMIVTGEVELSEFRADHLYADFKVEYVQGVYRLAPLEWSLPPHHAHAYYDEKRTVLVLQAMTDEGYEGLTATLQQCGIAVPEFPDIRVSPVMKHASENLLNRKVLLFEYDSLFTEPLSPDEEKSLEGINRLFALAVPLINANKALDYDALATESGIDRAVVEQVLNGLASRIQGLKSKEEDKRR